MRQEVCQLSHDCPGLSGNQPFEVAAQSLQQRRLVDKVRQRNHREDEHGHNRQQGVVRNGPGQQQALVGAESLQRADGEGSGMPENLRGVATRELHGAACEIRAG